MPASPPPLKPDLIAPPPARPVAEPQRDRDLIVVTRSVVVMQGSLLLLLAMLGFVTGYFVARSYGPSGVHQPQPSFITGKVQFRRADGELVPDESATVLLLPVAEVPDRTGKLPVYGLRPHDEEAGSDAATDETLRALGGDLCRASGDGFYHLRVRDSGDYFILFLSAHVQRADSEPLDRQMLAELGRYVDRANELIGPNAFIWKRLTIEKDLQLSETF